MRLYLQLASDAQLRQTGTATLALITKSEIVLDTANHWPYDSSGHYYWYGSADRAVEEALHARRARETEQ